jgi:hypothetical protein
LTGAFDPLPVGCVCGVTETQQKKKKKKRERERKQTTIRNAASHDPLCQERKAGTLTKLGAF